MKEYATTISGDAIESPDGWVLVPEGNTIPQLHREYVAEVGWQPEQSKHTSLTPEVAQVYGGVRAYAMKAIENDYPTQDGITHINIYSKGATELGKMLTNISDIPFTHPQHGKFSSVEGFWYTLTAAYCGHQWTEDQLMEIKRLKTCKAFTAKKIGKDLFKDISTHLDDDVFEEFKIAIEIALRCKVDQNQDLKLMLIDSHLPFEHYYYYGKPHNAKVHMLPAHQWQMDLWDKIRTELQADSTEYLPKLHLAIKSAGIKNYRIETPEENHMIIFVNEHTKELLLNVLREKTEPPSEDFRLQIKDL